MTLFTRVTRLFKADIHGVLDALEEPEAILRQAVREMDDEIEKSRLQLKTLDKQIENLLIIKKKLTAKQAETEKNIDYAFTEDNEVLIKSQLRKKMEIKLQIDVMENRLMHLNDDKNELQNGLNTQNEKLKFIIEKMNVFTEQPANPMDIEGFGKFDTTSAISKEEIELAYLYEKKQRADYTQDKSSTGEEK